ncbi:3550_t:CDS:1, partial [Cetraspora pellucida]
QLLAPQNIANLFPGTSLAIQKYTDLAGGTDPFARTQRTNGAQIPPQNAQFLTQLFLGISFSHE